MARIIYGVAGEGSGHASRAKIIIEYLLSQGHEISIVSHDRGLESLSQDFLVEKIEGLKFTYKNNSVRYLSSILKVIERLPKVARSFEFILKKIDEYKPDLIITDFEALTALAASIKDIPLLSIDNQHSITSTTISYPREASQEILLTKNYIRYIIPRADAYFVTTFFDVTVKNKKTFLFPPIVRQEILNLHPSTGDFLLVYTTAENPKLISILHDLQMPCVVYGATKTSGHYPLITFKQHNSEEFLHDLANCKAVVATAGFSLISEALHLRKPYFALPVQKHFEQFINAFYLKKMGLGEYSADIQLSELEHFLKNLPHYKRKLTARKRVGNKKIFQAINKFIERFSSSK